MPRSIRPFAGCYGGDVRQGFPVTTARPAPNPAIDPNPRIPAPEDRRAPSPAGRGAPPDLSPSERRLLSARDPGTLGLFYDLYFDRVYGYVKRMLEEEHLAEDVTQDVFMHVHRSLDSYDPARELSPWVFTIATNKVRDVWRSMRNRDGTHDLSLDDEEVDASAVSTRRGPLPALENEELGRLLADAIAELPEVMRSTLLLRYFEGLSFEAIAKISNRNETAVRKRYSRALGELREALARYMGPGRPPARRVG